MRALGDFALEARGRTAPSTGKAARRPLELLKFIAVSGRRSVPAAQAIAALWPDLEGDQAKSAFNVALHRLRKVLGDDDAIALSEGRLTLAEGRFWIDVHAFERYCSVAEAESATKPTSAIAAAQSALAIYRGPLLSDEEEQPWWLVQRASLAEKHTRVATLLGRHWMAAGEPERARAVFEKAIDLDPMAEEAYRQLMLVLLAMGLQAEALKVYRRCREMLTVALGMTPSADTERVYREIRDP